MYTLIRVSIDFKHVYVVRCVEVGIHAHRDTTFFFFADFECIRVVADNFVVISNGYDESHYYRETKFRVRISV